MSCRDRMGRHTYTIILGLLTLFMIIQPGFGDYSGQNQSNPDYVPGSVLVRTSDISESGAAALSSAHAAIHASVTHDYAAEGINGMVLVSLPDTISVPDAVTYYQGVSGVAWAEPDYYREILKNPEDPDFWRQWGLNNIGQQFKENTTPGKAGADIRVTSAWNTATGGNNTVAVLDTGADYRHPDLAANIWTDPLTGTHGYDTITGSLDPMDQDGHGTHCAGVIGGVANNRIGISGVNWNASIMPVRFIDRSGQGRVSDEISAITWAIHHGATVVSCSFGSTNPSSGEKEVIAGSDALFVIAAGNENRDNNLIPLYPASYNLPNIISVASVGPNETLSDFSNFGNHTVHLAAPGEEIYSTVRCLYQPEPVWHDPFDSLDNWTGANWTLNNRSFVSPPCSAWGENSENPGEMILTLNQSIDLKNLKHPVISYQTTSPTAYSGLRLEIQSPHGSYWREIDWNIRNFDPNFTLKQAQIPPEFEGSPISIRFVISPQGKALLDDIMISDGYGTCINPQWNYESGTSMATPMVAGAANLLLNYAPQSGWNKVRTAILNSTDTVADLQGKTITGGTLNITAALIRLAPPPVPDTIPVYPGWNHVSVPKRLSAGDDTAEKVFGALVNTSGHSVLTYRNGSWSAIPRGETIQPLTSYWLYTTSPQDVPYNTDPNQTGEYHVELKKGWNGFGVVGKDTLSAKIRLMPVNSDWRYVIGYNPETQTYGEPIINGGSGNQSDSRVLIPSQGYWLYMTGDTRYSVFWA